MQQKSELPEGWAEYEMGDLSTIVGGGTPTTSEPSYFTENGISWITPADLSEYTKMYISKGKRSLSESGLKSCSARIMPAGTVLMSSRAPIGYLAIASNPLCTNQGFKSFVCKGGVVPEYVYFWLKFKRPLIESMGSGSTFKEVSGSRAKTIPICMPPTPEQHRIVAAIEALFARMDATSERLDRVPEIMKAFRQAVLAAAYTGNLTSYWREQQSNLLNAKDLMVKIQREQEQAEGNTGKKIKTVKSLTTEDIEELPEISKEWQWSKLGSLIEEPKYGTSKKCDSNMTGRGVLRIPNIVNGSVNDLDMKYAQFSPSEEESYQLKEGDILTIRSNGSVDLVGKCALIRRQDEKYLYAGYLIRLRPIASHIESKYLLYCFSSRNLRQQIELKAKSTSGVNNINSGELKSLSVPFCSLPEQQEIVRRVDALFGFADSVEAKVAAAREKTERLRQSILAKAFSGELVPTEAEIAREEGRGYESAGELVGRIKAEGEK
ncbi:restriction endonuclease subunit S [Methanolobus psychrotolerans]|uniref:restriction endonuclease subunit S n=1 Tax=Methanolobus psychrotolerans TaxID=1874706 RepID=UPI000B91BEA8|nr:restriction endonuclease subunit S [Methanolobus psychrotolerans]